MGRGSAVQAARRALALMSTLALACAAITAMSASAAFAGSKLKEEFAPFIDCPTSVAGLIAARDGNTLSKTPLTLPGGLTGIEGLGGEVTATAEVAGPVSGILVNQFFLAEGMQTAVVLPLKIKLSNPILGEDCYIGSDTEPVVLHLTDGTTSPPFPNHPISGSRGTLEDIAHNKIITIKGNTLVDNSFAAPAATGCGTGLLAPVIGALVNLDAGLPSGAGHNTAIMSGSFELTQAAYAAKYAKPPKEKKGK
jgi:hypothetical protein